MRNKFFLRAVAVFFCLNILFEALFPTIAFALTGGPAQPESSSFAPVGTSDMVNTFSGDFSYNIPLMDVGGYPVNISYQSGISMDQEASWVGLGWNINPGAINRNMRGLPDDFNGDMVTKEFNVKANQTYGLNLGFGFEIAGFEALGLHYGIGAKYNNYTGVGFEQSVNLAFTAGEKAKNGGTTSLGLKSSADGLDISASVSASHTNDKKEGADTKFGASIGTGFNSRSGLKALTISASLEKGRVAEAGDLQDDGTTPIDPDDVGKFSASRAGGTGTSISMSGNSYVPGISMPMKNTSITASFKTGPTAFSADVSVDLTGYYSEQRLAETSQNVPAYGFLYSQNGQILDKVLLDFNREKEGSFTKNTPSLPLTNFTYDIFSVSGQGVGGVFRPFRSDIGYVFDSRTSTTSDSYSIGAELGYGNLVKGGVDVSVTDVNSSSGKWTSDNTAAGLLNFRGKAADNLYEPAYFKEQGEKNVDSEIAFYNASGGAQPVRIGLEGNGTTAHATSNLIGGEQTNTWTTHPLTSTNTYRTKRQRRNQLFSFINRSQYEKAAVETTLDLGIYDSQNADHIAEITTSKTDGSRYVYGIPAYNTHQKEVTFSMGGRTALIAGVAGGMIEYVPSTKENSTSNKNGIDNYYSSTTLPPYAHSYLLTAVLSPDYVDITGDGLSTDDYGTYTKFSYTKASAKAGTNGIYNWRVPYQVNKANYNEGLKTETMDDQANYIYGKKEIWVLDKIESKNYVAIFTVKTTGDRADGFDVAGEDGGLGDNTTPLLKKISLYSKPDYDENKTNLANAVPIKEVHFVYNYSLCLAIPNNVLATNPALWTWDQDCEEATNDGGKLTLKQIYFTYGKSFKAKFNPYKFTYGTSAPVSNPSYGLKDYDKWGNYKPDNPTTLPNSEFPYVEQDNTPITSGVNYDANYPYRRLADLYASAWSLTKVELPSGGIINVEYESDDYAYVQDRRAMQMFKITGADPDNTENPTASNFINGGPNPPSDGDYLFFKLHEPVSASTYSTTTLQSEFIKENYLKGIKDLYFRILAKVVPDPDGVGGPLKGNEYVSGYASIDLNDNTNFGISNHASAIISGYNTHGYIRLANVSLDDNDVSKNTNPISKAAVQFARINTPKKAYGSNSFPEPDENPEKVSLGKVLNDLADANILKNIKDAFMGPNGALYNTIPLGRELGREIELDKSWVRLLNPNFKKLGGGSRVRKITISDEWASMGSGAQSFSYGQEYDYEKFENGKKVLVNGNPISSGVASYEPMVGGDENPFRLPVSYSEKMKLAADLDYYKEEPFGESFFPSPSVGYSSVIVKNLKHTGVTRHATGFVVNEYYTTKDFPVITRRTPVDAKATTNAGQALKKLLKLKVKDYMTASQGFSIELNDMNGKQKATWVYAEDQTTPISGVEYKYKSSGNKLVNTAVAMEKNGNINHSAQIGIDFDFVADLREQNTDVFNMGVGSQGYSFLVPFPPFIIMLPPFLPIMSSEQTRFRSASTTKVIQRFGLLDETIAYDLGSKVSTRNLAYDAETGGVLLSKTKNDFNDEVFSLTYPSHLAYDRMGPGYQNVSVVLNDPFDVGGKVKSASSPLVPGDEVLVTAGTNVNRYWINKENTGTFVINSNGQHVTSGISGPTVYVEVIRSGRRNQQTLPVGSFTSLDNPIPTNVTQFPTVSENYRILSAGASEFSEEWRNFCECGINPDEPYGKKNPYLLGLLGNWRPQKSYTFLSDRNQTKINDNSNIRKDGTYTFFKPFWSPNIGKDWSVPTDLYLSTPPNSAKTSNPDANWTWTSVITEFSPFGPELENKDALDRYSSAIYGYNNALPMAVSSNARYKEIAFDGFEDYDFDDCVNDHFSFELATDPEAWAAYEAKQGGSASNYGSMKKKGDVTIDDTKSHSGKRSIRVPVKGSVTLTKNLGPCPEKYVPPVAN